MRIVVTGSKGMLGKFVVDYSRQQGADVLGVDQAADRGALMTYLSADLTDLGQVYDAISGAEAIIHLAAIPTQRMFPGARTFMTNVGMSYNILEAAARLGIQRVVMASSIQVNHSVTPRRPIRYQYLPLDEIHPPNPQDEYGLSKLIGETSADAFATNWGLTVVSLRFVWIARPEAIPGLPVSDPELPRIALYAYIHAQDAARACYLAAVADLPPASHTVAFVTAKDSYLDLPSLEYAKRFFPEAEIRPGLEGYGSLVSGARAAQVLGFVPEFSIREQRSL